MNVVSLGLLAVISASILSSEAGEVFNSETEFSGIQGQANWYYGYYDGDSASPYTAADFEEMPKFINDNQWIIHRGDPSGYWTSLYATGGHPNGPIRNYYQGTEHWAVRRWISNVSGTIFIEGRISQGSSSGDGVTCSIHINDSIVYSQHINGPESRGIDYSVAVEVRIGDIVDFIIQPGSYDMFDSTRFSAVGIMSELPVADAGPDMIEYDQVTFDAFRSYDPDGELVSYLWKIVPRHNPDEMVIETGSSFVLAGIPRGFYDVTLTVTDNEGFTDTDQMLLAVQGPVHLCEFTAEDIEAARNEGYQTGYTNGYSSATAIYNPTDCTIEIPALESNGKIYQVRLYRRGNSELFTAKEGSAAFPAKPTPASPSREKK